MCGDLDTGRTLVRVVTHGDPDQRPVAALGAARQADEHRCLAAAQASTAHRACEMVPVELTSLSHRLRRRKFRW